MSNLRGMFTIILNMSITASYVVIAVIFVRIFLRKAPKIFSYALWAVVLFRLVCPLSFTTAFSFLGVLIMWLSFVLMSRDMEMSCDESVLQRMGHDAKCGYSKCSHQ